MSKIVNEKSMRTKIIATIGPASCSKDILREMILAGLSVCRLNFSHGKYENHEKVIQYINELNIELDTHVAILADLQGPKIRVGDIVNNEMEIKIDDIITFTTDEKDSKNLYISYQEFPKDVKKGDSLLIDDGKLMLEVVESDNVKIVKAKVVIGGILSSHKGVNLPNTKINIPSLTPKDLRDLDFILKHEIHWVALSFVRSAKDVHALRKIIFSKKKEKRPWIISKIEKPEALDDIDKIIKASDGLMVARGDLGVEIPFQQVPLVQKKIIRKCLKHSRPIIVATQMMEGMLENIRPTRAEVNDVANSALDGADALMLSGETSVGKYPVESIKAMRDIIADIEGYGKLYYKHNPPPDSSGDRFISQNLIYMACAMAKQINAAAILTLSHGGFSARDAAGHRPKAHVLVNSHNRFLLCQLNIVWGIMGFYSPSFKTLFEANDQAIVWAKSNNVMKDGDLLVSTSSLPVHRGKKTNSIKVTRVE